MSEISRKHLGIVLVVHEIISHAKFLFNIILAILSDERLGCRRTREWIVRYVMAHRMPGQISCVFRLTCNNDADCLSQLRMDMSSFSRLCYLLQHVGGLRDSKYVRIDEKVCFILSVLSHHKMNWTIKFDHVRSGHTVSLYFHSVLTALLKLHPLILVTPKPVDDDYTNARWKSFKGCIGALDRMYIDVQTPLLDKPRYCNRKGGISVNVLGVVNREMNFVYMLPGWEGSTADGRVLRDAVNRVNGLKVPNGQYYLCDNGYMNCPGFLAPYRSIRYHLDEWSAGSRAPQNAKELFNQRHTKARNNRMILACALLHNFIRREMEVDPAKAHVPKNHQETYNDDQPSEVDYVESIDSSNEWSMWRDNLANELLLAMAHTSSVGTSCKGKKAVVCRRMWTRPAEDVLVQALKELLTTGWKSDNGFRVGYLNVLQVNMMMAFPRTDLRSNPHISSKMHSWKKQYNTLFTIFGGTDVGWNSTTKMIETDDDEAGETACKNEPSAQTMRYKSWPYFDAWFEVFGKDRADGTGAEDFHDALNGILHAESQPKSPPDTHLDDNDMTYTPLVDEDAPPSVCEAGSSTTTKTSNKGKQKKEDSIIGPIMAGINKFTNTTDSRLGEIVSKMGHQHDMTCKCQAVLK
ncbi:hypothetical protein BUALT_Bualt12G0090200 [Buddleja alternifolia]|uniref:Transposase n=1 Tax=Buddleja alternifolia TaxID=168488 RepID=A0AAV6WUL6_9LAMI|nr:hypothetical protein BUALT_Bualt12G0090200 [Buddleja alternifolia]